MILCVYALTGAGRVSGLGLSGERLHVVGSGPVRAVVGELARAPRATTPNILKYDETIRRLAAHVPALLPARFGTCFADVDELLYVLGSRRAALARDIAHVRNRVQMTIRIVGPSDGDSTPARTLSRPGDVHPPATGREYLLQRAAAAAAARHVPGFEPVRAALQRWVRDERVDKSARVTTVYHLVPRASAAAYCRALERGATAAGLHFRVTGPWPAYAFAKGL